MAKNDFKTAAAKLLAKHPAKILEAPIHSQKYIPQSITEPNPPPQSTPYLATNTETIIDGYNTSSAYDEQNHINHRPPRLRAPGFVAKFTLIPLAGALGWTIMVFALPETIFGTLFNHIFGAAGGALLGYLIVKDL